MKLVFHLKVERAKLVTDIDFQNHLHSLEGKDVDCTVAVRRFHRSNPQNAYFHSVIVKGISDHTGYEVGEVKEMIRMMFLAYELKVGDEIIKVGRSTASLSTVEMEELNSQCRRWASQTLDLYLCEPNQVAL